MNRILRGLIHVLTRPAMVAFVLAHLLLFAVSAQAQEAAPRLHEVCGHVIDAETGTPLPAAVRCGASAATAGDDGSFCLELPAGNATLETTAEGYVARSLEVVVSSSGLSDIQIGLVPRGRFKEEVEVLGRASAPAVLPVRPSQVMEVAGGAENVLRVVQTLPGVAGADEFGGRYSVRGGGPDQNLTVMDGVEIYNPYRLFGLSSAFNPETVESFELTAGAFSAQYGDRLSSLLVVENRAGSREKPLTGSAALSLMDMNVILEGRLPKSSGSWLFSARRTWYDLIGQFFTDSDLPSFNDLQGKTVFDLGSGRSLSLFALRSRESTDATFDFEDEGAEGAIYTRSKNDVFSANLRIPIGNRFLSRTIASNYKNTDSFDFGGDFRNDQRRSNSPDDSSFHTSRVEITWEGLVEDWSLRQELSIFAARNHVVETGFELHRLETHVGFTIPAERNPNEANGSSLGGGATLPDVLDSQRTDSRLGAWLEDRFQVAERLVLEPGVRVDHTTVNGATSVSPRFTAIYSLTPSYRLKLGLGLFTQSPGYEKLIQSDYFMDLSGSERLPLQNERSRHALFSLEHDFSPAMLGRVEAYYKGFDRLIIGRLETPEETLARVSMYDFPPELAYSVPTDPLITTVPTNDGSGRSYGFDVYVARRQASARTRLTGWASYTFGVARRDAYDRTYPFDYDRRHALSVVGQYRVTDRFEVALTARVASGFPRTPVTGLVVAATPDPEDPERLIPERDPNGLLVYTTDYGGLDNLNSRSLPVFARIDARATYAPAWGRGHVRFYLDIINLLNRHNAGIMQPELEYDENADRPRLTESPDAYLPFLPSFGIHVTFSGGAPSPARTKVENAAPKPGPDSPWALALRPVGTQGLGLDLARSLSSRLSARVGFGIPTRFKFDESASSTDYDCTADLGALQTLLDVYPFKRGFRVTVGALGTRHGFDIEAKPADSYQIGGVTYPGDQVGTLSGQASVRRLIPYFGLGWGNAFAKEKRISVAFDVGVAPQGTPSVTLSASGPLAADPAFQEDLLREAADVQDRLDSWRIFPVVSFTISRRF